MMSQKKDKKQAGSLNINLDEANETTQANRPRFPDADQYRGVFGRWRLFRDRNRARVGKWWSYYLENAVPENEDDVPEGWPRIFGGTLGRWLLAGCSLLMLGVWAFLIYLVWTL